MDRREVKVSGVLSVAIPVLNFGEFLPATLNSILSQEFGNQIEILVFDSGSTDSTFNYMKNVTKNHKNVRFVRALKPCGIDLDMSRSVDLTSSEYCWLFSGDDVMHNDGLKRILLEIEESKPSLILTRHNECDKEMNLIRDWPIFDLDRNSSFDLSDETSRYTYFAKSLTSEAVFSFMSGLIIQKKVWLNHSPASNSIGSNWAHVSRLLTAIRDSNEFRTNYLHQPILDRRGGNDSFSKNGMLPRLSIQIDGLLNTCEEIFGTNSFESQNLKRLITNEVFPQWVAAVKAEIDRKSDRISLGEELARMLTRLNHP
jgi:abequosyltransferase